MSRTPKADLVPVVVYLRCSSPQQELSTEEQRQTVVEFCKKKGYRILREYVDEGKSGSKDTSKRIAFAEMVQDSFRREFTILVCYDLARFGRLDNLEGGTPKDILRKNGVALDSVKEGLFDWNTPEGRWKDQAYVEANRSLALNISVDSIRGRSLLVKAGYWPCGSVPYGYDRDYTDGTHHQLVRRSERYKKGRNWHLKLVVNEAEAQIVREIFDRVANGSISMRALGMELTARRIPPPEPTGGKSSGAWDKDTVRSILVQSAYIGVVSFGKGRRTRTVHNKAEPVEVEGACPVLVDRQLWQACQELLARKRAENRKPQYHRSALLSGFLVCGHCGFRMKKAVYPKTARVYYTCDSARKRPHLQCHQWKIYEDKILGDVMSWLVKEVDFELLQAMQARPDDGKGAVSEATLMQRQVAELERKTNKGRENALLAPANVIRGAWEQIALWQEELDQARERLSLLQAVQNTPGLTDLCQWWADNRETLVRIGEPLPEPTTHVQPFEFPLEQKTAMLERIRRDGFAVVRVNHRGDYVWCDEGEGSGRVTVDANGRAWLTEDVYQTERPDVLVRRDTFRALLFRLGFEVRLRWRHDPEARRNDRTATEYHVASQEISVKIRLKGETSPAAHSITHGNSVLAFRRVRSLPLAV